MELAGKPETQETICFIRTFDKAFDCLNVSKFGDGKPDRQPYIDVNDPRFQVRSDVYVQKHVNRLFTQFTY